MAIDAGRRVVLVTGASGAVGPALVERLLQDGYDVRVYSRHAYREVRSDKVTVYTGDLGNRDALNAALAGVEAVFHLAALLHIVNPPAALLAEYERVNVEGTRTLVEASLSAGVKRVVLFSTIAVYGSTGGHMIDEATPPRPDSGYGSSKLAAEEIVRTARNDDGAPLGTVLRLAAVYGPRLKGNYERLVRALANGRFVPIGKGHNRRTLVFDKDAAGAAIAVQQAAAAAGRTYNVTDGACHTMHDVIRAICDALGRKAPAWHIPAAPVRSVARTIETVARTAGLTSPLGAATIDKYLEDVAVRGTLIGDEVGWTPRVDLRDGFVRTVQGMRSVGRLG